MILLQVMICTYGKDGISRVAKSSHPTIDGVEYIVGWQHSGEGNAIPENIASRKDFKIYKSGTIGLSKNRNFLLRKASAPLLLLSDDDVDYSENQLKSILKAFDDNPDYDLLTFMYDSEKSKKNYPNKEFNLRKPVKGYYPTSFEIAFRNNRNIRTIQFNELFGIGAMFPSGEEEIFINDCKKKNLKCKFIPLTICRHDTTTTSDRDSNKKSFIQTKGAVIFILFPFSWPLRMMTHAYRHYKKNKSIFSFFQFINNWLQGVVKLIAAKIHTSKI